MKRHRWVTRPSDPLRWLAGVLGVASLVAVEPVAGRATVGEHGGRTSQAPASPADPAAPVIARLVGNWVIQWSGRPSDEPSGAYVTVSASGQPGLVDVSGVSFTDRGEEPTLSEHGLLRMARVLTTGVITFTTNDWYTVSTLRLAPDGRTVSGQWTHGGRNGIELWQRVEFKADQAAWGRGPEAKPRPPAPLRSTPLRIAVDSSRTTSVYVDVYGSNIWGIYTASVEPSPGVVVDGNSHVCKNGESYRSGTWQYCNRSPRGGPVAMRYVLTISPDAQPGPKALIIGNDRVPFELILTNHAAANLRFVEEISNAFVPLKELAFHRPFRIEAVYPTPQQGNTREVTLSWDGASAPRKVILRLAADGVFRSDPLTVVPPRAP
jgi:hypothetical protein